MPKANHMNIVPKATIDWLLDPENPSVRYLTLTKLIGRSERNTEVREARSAIMRSGAVPNILDLQERAGYWGKPDSFYTAKYQGTVWQLITLAELGADGRDERIQRACEFVLAHSQDPQSGGFSQKRAKRAGGGLPSDVIPCLTGNLVWSLQLLGYASDERIDAGVIWLTRFLRFDDGDSAPPSDFPYIRWEMCYGRHSCSMGVVKGLKALSAIPPVKRSKGSRKNNFTFSIPSRGQLSHLLNRGILEISRIFLRFRSIVDNTFDPELGTKM